MPKYREKARRLFRRDGRATVPSEAPALSEGSNAPPSNLTERHIRPDLPVQWGSTNAEPQIATPLIAQAISTASLAHAADTQITPSVPAVSDHSAELGSEAEERQPGINLTERRTLAQSSDGETSPDSFGVLQPRPSCWDQAAKRLKDNRPNVYTKLEKIKSKYMGQSQIDPAALLESAKSKMRKNKKIPRVIETTIRSILQFKQIVAAAANFDHHKIAPIVWQGFCVVLEAFLGESTQLREALKDLDAITSNLSYWANVESLFLSTTKNDNLKKFELLEFDLVKLYTEVLELEVELVNWASEGALVQAFKTQDRSVTWKDLIGKVSVRHDACKSAFDRCKMEIDQYGKIKKWISDYKPEQAHDDALQRTGVAKKYRTCGRWLLDNPRFIDWSSPESSSDCRILWLRGTVGTGKSTLMARIIQWHLDRASLYPGHQFAYFYCSRGIDLSSKHSYKSVLQALLRQAAYDPVKCKISTQVLDAYINAGGDSVDLRSFSFTQCETLLHGILNSGIRLRIMIDALDECDEPKELLKALRDASRIIPGGFELLVSSRHEVRVHEKFSNAVIIDLDHDRPVYDTDMATYITTEIQDREEDERILKGKHPDLEDRLIQIICERAGGMFRWAQLQLSLFLKPNSPFLRPETVEKHLNQLDTGSAAVQKDLNIAYDDIFKRNTAKGTLEHDHASKIYRMLLCWMGRLSIANIIQAVAFDEDSSTEFEGIDNDYIRQLTQDFIVETTSGILEFSHVSVKDYLQGKHQLDYSNAKCHAQVARMCLKYISSQERATYEAEVQRNEFLLYSSWSWGEHCAQLSKEDRQDLGVSRELLDWIIEGSGSTKFQDWLYMGSELGLQYIRHPGNDPSSIVFFACEWNLVEVLETLALAGPVYGLPLGCDSWGRNPLSLAAYGGHKAVIELMLKTKNVAVDPKSVNVWTPLFWASSRGHAEVVKLLLDNGADVTAVDKDGLTPLHLASNKGYVEVAKLLLDNRADVAAADNKGWTPLHLASGKGYVEAVKLLLQNGADKLAIDNEKWTPLDLALKYVNNEVKNPWYWDSTNDHAGVVKLLSGSG